MALYSDVIRERFRRPLFRGAIERPDVAHEDVNPLCGDRVRIQGRLADGRLAEARWTGDCCAICAASADLLLEAAPGPAGRLRAGPDALEPARAARFRYPALTDEVRDAAADRPAGALSGQEVTR